MPELPEVETVRRGLERVFAENNIIAKIELRRPDLRVAIPRKLPALMREQPIVAVRRRAKYLLLDTPTHSMISHLGMSGTWRVAPVGEEIPHDHVYLTLKNGTRLAFNDPRRFGILDVAARNKVFENRWLKNLGAEPFADEFHEDYLFEKARGKTAPVKNFLMDQKIVVGIGNIYASEALFAAGVKPLRTANRVKKDEWKKIILSVRHILQKSIERGGTTLRDHRMVDGENGGFQNQLDVYDREGEDCHQCNSPIRQKVVAGRSTYWCGQCQK